MAEKEQAHRHACEAKLVDSQVEEGQARSKEMEARSKDRRLLIWLSCGLLTIAIVLAFVAVITSHPAGAGLAGGSGIVAVAGIIYGATRKKKSDEEDSGSELQ